MTMTFARSVSARLALAGIAAALIAPAAHGFILTYPTTLNGANESPANSSTGVGSALITFDTDAHTMRVQAAFSGLTGNVTACHIHAATANPFAGTAGVASQTPSFTGFPTGVRAGSYDRTFDMTLASSYNAAYITANGGTPASAESALIAAAGAGKAYLNIHSSTFGGGEIRGFVPTPGTAMLVGIGGLAAARRRRA